MKTLATKEALYAQGIDRSCAFLKENELPFPRFVRYDSPGCAEDERLISRLISRRATVGMSTGFHRMTPVDGKPRSSVYVNIGLCANPVLKPAVQSWSWPCWKTDRTPLGVTAHEVGHHCVAHFQAAGVIDRAWGLEWHQVMRGKKVSGYEPTPEEALVETLRLFILNPDLLQKAIPRRYDFIARLLKPSEKRPWQEVLGDCDLAYLQAGDRWTR